MLSTSSLEQVYTDAWVQDREERAQRALAAGRTDPGAGDGVEGVEEREKGKFNGKFDESGDLHVQVDSRQHRAALTSTTGLRNTNLANLHRDMRLQS